jgi:hypothetical protein
MDQLQGVVAVCLAHEHQRTLRAWNTGIIILRGRFAVHFPRDSQTNKVPVERDHPVDV